MHVHVLPTTVLLLFTLAGCGAPDSGGRDTSDDTSDGSAATTGSPSVDSEAHGTSSSTAGGGSLDAAPTETTGTGDSGGDATDDTTAGSEDLAELCPVEGRATLRLGIEAKGVRVAAVDRLTYALFASWPPTGAPARSQQHAGAALAFPTVLIDTEVEPGSYVVYVCFDPGGDSPPNGACGAQDHWLLHDGGRPLSIAAGQVIRLEVDVLAGVSTVQSVEDAGALGCALG